MRSMALGLVLATLAGCGKKGPNGPETFEAKRAEMQAYVEPIHAKIAADPPPLTADGLTDVKGPLTSWLQPNGNAVVLSESQVKEMHTGGVDNAMITQKTHAGVDMGKFTVYGTIDFAAELDWLYGKTFSNFKPTNYDAAHPRRRSITSSACAT